MKMYQDERKLDFHALGREIKRKREAKGWTQEYLAQLVDRTPRSIMYFENRGQHPSLNTFYQLVTLLDISVDDFFYQDKQNGLLGSSPNPLHLWTKCPEVLVICGPGATAPGPCSARPCGRADSRCSP